MSKPGKVLKGLCKKLGVRLTIKRNGKRVYKSVAVLKRQCANKKKKKKVKRKRKRRRKFGMGGVVGAFHQQNALREKERVDKAMNIEGLRKNITGFMGEMNKNTTLEKTEKNIELIIKREKQSFPGISLKGLMVNTIETGELGLRQYHQRPRDKKLQQKKYFDKLHLKKANFNMSKMWRVYFRKSILEQATFFESYIYSCMFIEANLKKVDFTNATAEGNNFSDCDMREANFTNASMKSCWFGSADLRGANFTKTNLEDANFEGADLRGANFTEAVFETGHNISEVNHKFKKAIYDNNTIFPNGFIPSEHGAMHVDDWKNLVQNFYSAGCMGGRGDGGSGLDYLNTWRENEKIRYLFEFYKKKINDEIQKFSNDEINKFKLRRNLDIFCSDFYDQIMWIRGRSKAESDAAIKIQALFKNNKKEEKERLRRKEEREKNAANIIQAMFKKKKKREIERLRRKEERLKQLGGLGALGVLGGGAYLGSKYLKKKRPKKVKKSRKKVKKKRKKVKKRKVKRKRKRKRRK